MSEEWHITSFDIYLTFNIAKVTKMATKIMSLKIEKYTFWTKFGALGDRFFKN